VLYPPHNSIINSIERRGEENEYDRCDSLLAFLEEDKSRSVCYDEDAEEDEESETCVFDTLIITIFKKK
jgi:hypothetical protein